MGRVYKNVDFSTRTGFPQCHHGFSIARHTSEQIYAWGQMLYLGFGLFLKMGTFRMTAARLMLVEVVSSFPYLGSLITDDAECTKDIRRRLANLLALEQSSRRSGRTTAYAFLQRSVLWKHLYGLWLCTAVSWTLKKDDEKRISAFEMKCLRKVLRVSWTAKRTNERVLETAGVSRSLLASVKKQVAQLSQRDRAEVWASCGANINVVFRIQRTLL